MKSFTVHCEYSAQYRFETTVEAEDAVGACRAAVDLANESSDWSSQCGPTPSYVVALAPGAGADPWRDTPEGAIASVLPVPGLFTDTARVAGYAATRSEDLILQLRIMLDAIGDDGRLRIDPKAMVRLRTTGRAILADVDGFGLPSERSHDGGSGSATAAGSPGAG